MRMPLSSCTMQRSASERLGTFSRSHASEISLVASEINNEEALKHVLKNACEQVHLEYSNTRLETPASNGRGENSVRTMKETVQRQKDAVSRWALSVPSNILFSRCWCDTVSGY